MRIALEDAIRMLPRYDRKGRYDDWRPCGRLACINLRKLPANIDKLVHKIINKMDVAIEAGTWHVPVRRIDVTGDNLWVLHRSVSARNLRWLCRQNWAWQKWHRHKLPVYVLYHGKIIIWNGTHRMTLARLARRKVRVRVLDIDAYFRSRKGERNARAKGVSKPHVARRAH